MLTPDPSHIETQLTAAFGKPTQWNPETSVPSKCLLWTNNLSIELLLIYQQAAISDAQLRQIHHQRKAKRPVSLIVIAPPNTRQQHHDRARIAGPSAEAVVRTIQLHRIIALIESIQSKSTREASSFIERELQRLEASVIPGIRVKDLLTPHYIRTRLLQRPADKKTPNIRNRSSRNHQPLNQLAQSIQSPRIPHSTHRQERIHPTPQQ